VPKKETSSHHADCSIVAAAFERTQPANYNVRESKV